MKPKQNSLLRLFFRDESPHKLSLVDLYENARFRQERQQWFNFCTRQAAKKAWMRDSRTVEICRYFDEIGDYKLKTDHGRQWLHGRWCIRPGSPIRVVPLSNKLRWRFGGKKLKKWSPKRSSRRPDHI